MRRLGPLAGVLAAGLLGSLTAAAPRSTPPRLDPGTAPDAPTAIHRARGAVVGIRASVPADRPSAATLGTERTGSAVVITADGVAVTVGYLVLEADRIEARLADGRVVAAHVLGHDFESGLGLIRLDGRDPYPALALGRSDGLTPGTAVTIVGMGEERPAMARPGRIGAVQPFVAYWEYVLERALLVTPLHPAFGGAALVDDNGALVGIVSLRLPSGHVAIPIDLLRPVQAALVARGRPPGPGRPWLGIRAVAIDGGVGVASVSPAGPAHGAGLRPGDVIVRMNGERVADVGDLYRRLWQVPLGGAIELAVFREDRLETLTVPARDRYSVFQFRAPRLPPAAP